MRRIASTLYNLLFPKFDTVFHNLNIRYKLVLSYFLVTIIPITSIGFFSYSSTLSYIKSQYIIAVYNTQQQYNVNITNNLNGYKFLADAIYKDQKIQIYLDGTYSGYYQGIDIVKDYITPALNALLDSTGRSINLDLVKYSDISFEVITNFLHGISNTSTENNNELKIPEKAFNIFNAERIENKEWYSVVKKVSDYSWSQIGDDAKYNRITLIRPLINFSDPSKEQIGFLFITVMLEDILGSKEDAGGSTNELHMVFDRNGNMLSVDNVCRIFFEGNRDKLSHLLASPASNESLLLKDYIIVKGINELTGWKILSAIPINELNENVNKTRNITVLYCLLALLVLFAVTYLLSASFSRRITKISSRMKKLQNGNFECSITDVHNDEIGYLARAFNEMSDRIGSLIRDNYQANIDRKEAQLEALQAQINPHFLYNSLSCISRLGNIGDAANINKMVRALTTFYRMTLNKGKDIITIFDELEQVKAYIEIYKIRKGEDFTVEFRIDKSIYDYYTIKVILQPFVENILEHAMFNREIPINILISAKLSENCIIFEIIDDGIGMKREKLESILSDDSVPSKGYGIKNVDDRIKLQFGSEFGIEIFSRLGVGTKVVIKIPVYFP